MPVIKGFIVFNIDQIDGVKSDKVPPVLINNPLDFTHYAHAENAIKLTGANIIKGWLEKLKNDKKFIFQATSFASKAHQYVVAFQSN